MNENQPAGAPAQRKRRSDSPLWSLPEKKQAEIIGFLREHSLQDAAEWLGREGIQTSDTALSRFRAAYETRQSVSEQEATLEVVAEESRQGSKDGEGTLTEDELFAFGQRKFAAKAIRNNDGLEWHRMQRLRQNEEWLALEGRRVHLLEHKAEQAEQAEQVARTPLTPEEKEERIKQIFGIT